MLIDRNLEACMRLAAEQLGLPSMAFVVSSSFINTIVSWELRSKEVYYKSRLAKVEAQIKKINDCINDEKLSNNMKFINVIRFFRDCGMSVLDPFWYKKVLEEAKTHVYEVEPQYATYTLSSNAKFFASLCCDAQYHNYVTLGCVDEGQYYVLSSIGKMITYEAWKSSCGYLSLLFSPLCASLETEDVFLECLDNPYKLDQPDAKVFYQSQEISYEQYHNYTQLARAYTSNSLEYYYPHTQEDGKTKWVSTLEQRQIEPGFSPAQVATFKTAGNVSLKNTCRHSALEVMQLLDIDTKNMSSHFWKALPHEMTVKSSRIKSPFLFITAKDQTQAPYVMPEVNVIYQDLVRELLSYVKLRSAESRYTRFWGRFIGMNKTVKTEAVSQLIGLLVNKTNHVITDKERMALRDGRLGRIMAKYEVLLAGEHVVHQKWIKRKIA